MSEILGFTSLNCDFHKRKNHDTNSKKFLTSFHSLSFLSCGSKEHKMTNTSNLKLH